MFLNPSDQIISAGRWRRLTVGVVVVLALAAVTIPASTQTTSGSSDVLAFVGARVIDGLGGTPIENGTLIVRGGKIEAVGPSASVRVPDGARRISVTGKTIVPGLVNAHGHVNDTVGLRTVPESYTKENIEKQLALYARYGVTTVFSLGGDGEEGVKIRDAQTKGPLTVARLFVAGPVVAESDPAAARATVDKLAAMKVNFVKFRVDDNLGTATKMPQAAYAAVIEQAHKHGLKVATHVFYLADTKDVLTKGSDFIAHSIRDTSVDDALIAQLKQRDICVSPTLTREVSTFVYESRPAFFDDPFFRRDTDPEVIKQLEDPKRQAQYQTSKTAQGYKKALDVAMKNLKTLSDKGVRIAFGTDTGPPARFQGYFEHMELDLMAKSGMTPMQTLVAATSAAAACMGVSDRVGALKPGLDADILVLAQNPLENIGHTKSLESVWIRGTELPAKAR